MASKQIQIFATPDDLRKSLKFFEQDFPIQYIEKGLMNSSEQPIYFTVDEIPDFGKALGGAVRLES